MEHIQTTSANNRPDDSYKRYRGLVLAAMITESEYIFRGMEDRKNESTYCMGRLFEEYLREIDNEVKRMQSEN